MRPYTDLLGVARELVGIFTDIDDTLTHNGVLVPAAYQALAQARAAGLRVVAVTGRPAGYAEVLAATWPIDAAIAENGAFAVRRVPQGEGQSGGALERRYHAPEAARAAATEQLARLRHEIEAELPFARVADDQWLRRCDLAFDIGETKRLAADEIARLAAKVTTAGARTIVSTVHLHADFGTHDKAKMAVEVGRWLWGDDLDTRRDRYLYIGDSPNDQAGFAHFPRSAGPANVRRYLDRLAPPPAFVASKDGGHGFAEIVEAILGCHPGRHLG